MESALESEKLVDARNEVLKAWLVHVPKGNEFLPQGHRHNTMELTFGLAGTLNYLRGGARVQIPPRRFTVFWGSVPHHLIESRQEASYYALHLPLAWFMSWELPMRFVRRVLEGEIAFESRREQGVADAILFKEWFEDLEQGNPIRQNVVLREVCARLHRLAVILEDDKHWLTAERESEAAYGGGKAEQMAGHIARHFLEDLAVPQIAGRVGLHPKYASQLFSNKFGITIKRYITLNRLHRAELLLVTTDKSVLDVAMESGFGSESAFYGAFRKFIGRSPATYRHLMRKGAET